MPNSKPLTITLLWSPHPMSFSVVHRCVRAFVLDIFGAVIDCLSETAPYLDLWKFSIAKNNIKRLYDTTEAENRIGNPPFRLKTEVGNDAGRAENVPE